MKNLELISDVALAFLNQDSFDVQMSTVLQRIGERIGVSRAYVFLDSPDGNVTNNTHEWCAPTIAPRKGDLQGVPYAAAPSWRRLMAKAGHIFADDVSRLPKDLRSVLEPQGIKALVIYPLIIGNAAGGFVGVDDCSSKRKWKEIELTLLRTISGIISNVYERKLDRDRLEESEDNFRQFFDTVDDMMIIGDRRGKVLFANDAVSRKLGFSLEELQGMSIPDMHPPDKREEAERILTATVKREQTTCPLELLKKDGGRLPAETRTWFGQWGGQECIFGISKDLSKEQEPLQKFTRLFQNHPTLMTISTVENGNFLEVNRAFLEKLGYQRDEVIGKSSAELGLYVQPAQRASIVSELLRNGKVADVELEFRRKNGEVRSYLFSAEAIDIQGENYLLSVMVDITEKRLLEDQIRELSIRDSLTNIYNRRYIFGRLEEIAVEYGRKHRNFCVSILDLDHFKNVNDRYGHLVGDTVLREFAAVVSSVMRPYDLLGRYGGEEFIIVLVNVDKTQAATIMNRIMKVVRAKEIVYDDLRLSVTFSCGLADSAEFASVQNVLDAMVETADKRLYAAKEAGRDRLVSG